MHTRARARTRVHTRARVCMDARTRVHTDARMFSIAMDPVRTCVHRRARERIFLPFVDSTVACVDSSSRACVHTCAHACTWVPTRPLTFAALCAHACARTPRGGNGRRAGGGERGGWWKVGGGMTGAGERRGGMRGGDGGRRALVGRRSCTQHRRFQIIQKRASHNAGQCSAGPTRFQRRDCPMYV